MWCIFSDPNPNNLKSTLSFEVQLFRRTSDILLGKMFAKTRKILEDFYGPFNLELSQLLGSRGFLWYEPDW